MIKTDTFDIPWDLKTYKYLYAYLYLSVYLYAVSYKEWDLWQQVWQKLS